jgi:hypothetical protein
MSRRLMSRQLTSLQPDKPPYINFDAGTILNCQALFIHQPPSTRCLAPLTASST